MEPSRPAGYVFLHVRQQAIHSLFHGVPATIHQIVRTTTRLALCCVALKGVAYHAQLARVDDGGIGQYCQVGREDAGAGGTVPEGPSPGDATRHPAGGWNALLSS